MRVLLATTIYSPHLLPLADELSKIVGFENFRYFATQEVFGWRTGMGWGAGGGEPYFVQIADTTSRLLYDEWWINADVVLCCERDISRIARRCASGKLIFYITERWWRPPYGKARLLHPAFLRMALRLKKLSKNNCFHLLGIGRYALNDLLGSNYFVGRGWSWGYFTKTFPRSPIVKSNPVIVLYAGRFIRCKRLDSLLRAFKWMHSLQLDCELHMVGAGDKETWCRDYIESHGLSASVRLFPSLPMDRVWAKMQQSHVFVLPSNEQEGWGAVLNEAMSSGCVPVATRQSGAGLTMIRDGVNGRLFDAGDWKMLSQILCELVMDKGLRDRLSYGALDTINNLWSPEVAAARLCSVSKAILENGQIVNFTDGPMVLQN